MILPDTGEEIFCYTVLDKALRLVKADQRRDDLVIGDVVLNGPEADFQAQVPFNCKPVCPYFHSLAFSVHAVDRCDCTEIYCNAEGDDEKTFSGHQVYLSAGQFPECREGHLHEQQEAEHQSDI